MDEVVTRRALLRNGAVAVAGVAVAGCTDEEDPEGGDVGSGGGPESPTDTETDTPSNATGSMDTEPEFSGDGQIYRTADSFAFEGAGRWSGDGESYAIEIVGEYDSGDLGYTMTMDIPEDELAELEVYVVDEVYYVRNEHGCNYQEEYETPTNSIGTSHPDSFAGLEPVERSTYDGEPVRVYEIPPETLPEEYDEYESVSVTLYVSTRTGYIIAQDLDFTVTGGDSRYNLTYEYDSWGENLNIRLPADC